MSREVDRITADVLLEVAAVTEPQPFLPEPDQRQRIRREADISVRELAQVLGVPDLTMMRVERGFARFYATKDVAYRRVLSVLETKHVHERMTVEELEDEMAKAPRVPSLHMAYSPEDRRLMRLRLGVPLVVVAYLCKVGEDTAERYETRPTPRRIVSTGYVRYQVLLGVFERLWLARSVGVRDVG